MQHLDRHEQLELELLECLNSKRLLQNLIFCGGTMLRLCFGINRYSVDLDFWIIKENLDYDGLFSKISQTLAESYVVTDAANKFHTLLFEIKADKYPRSLKIEIRKLPKKVKTERAIAYSKTSSIQVMLNVVSLPDMMTAKIAAFLDRREIRDAFDIEFLIKKGIALDASPGTAQDLLDRINSLSKNDYRVALGALLSPEDRKYYASENFKILKQSLREKLTTSR